jgi:hypothetical protein
MMSISERKGNRNGNAILIMNQRDNHQKKKLQHTREYPTTNRKRQVLIPMLI